MTIGRYYIGCCRRWEPPAWSWTRGEYWDVRVVGPVFVLRYADLDEEGVRIR